MLKWLETRRLRGISQRILAKNADQPKVGGILPTGNTFFGDESRQSENKFIGIPPIWANQDATPSKSTIVSKFKEAFQPVFDKFRK